MLQRGGVTHKTSWVQGSRIDCRFKRHCFQLDEKFINWRTICQKFSQYVILLTCQQGTSIFKHFVFHFKDVITYSQQTSSQTTSSLKNRKIWDWQTYITFCRFVATLEVHYVQVFRLPSPEHYYNSATATLANMVQISIRWNCIFHKTDVTCTAQSLIFTSP